MMPDGKQCTVCWYVDDLKISHEKKEVVESLVEKIEERYGKMTVTVERITTLCCQLTAASTAQTAKGLTIQ
eukprot:scaffold55_cov113-Cylindrotheca_fusiformis.AAC.1